jgi:N-acetylneuraminate synthase
MRKRSFIVAEVSSNHGQSFKRAVSLIRQAKKAGADAVKFQAYTPGGMTADIDNKYFRVKHPKWRGQTLYQLYEKSYTPWAWFKKLKNISDDLGITFFSTAFDRKAVDFLEGLDVSIHKVASFEVLDLLFVEYVAKTKKPLILSTGMASVSEIKEAVSVARKGGAKDIILLRCVSSYPAREEDMNLVTIPDMRKRFKCPVGLSDHTIGKEVPVAAVSLGACLIEKHFTLSRKIKTPDNFFSMEPREFKELVKNIRITERAMGKVQYNLSKDEKSSIAFRRSLFAVKNIEKGERFSEENVKSIRPGYGLPPKHLKSILGRKAKRAIAKGSPLKSSLVSL